MVRKRGVARRSFAHRRVRRVKKYDHHMIPRRFKIQLPDLSDRLELELKDSVELEPLIEEELTVKGVPKSEWQYYEGFAKRMLTLYRHFTGETLQIEKTNLIEEYVLRGKDRDVLEQEQGVVEKYVFVPPTLTLFHFEEWNFGPPSVMPLQHSENWNYPDPPTFTLQHSEAWSS